MHPSYSKDISKTQTATQSTGNISSPTPPGTLSGSNSPKFTPDKPPSGRKDSIKRTSVYSILYV